MLDVKVGIAGPPSTLPVFIPHEHRGLVLEEVHARPFPAHRHARTRAAVRLYHPDQPSIVRQLLRRTRPAAASRDRQATPRHLRGHGRHLGAAWGVRDLCLATRQQRRPIVQAAGGRISCGSWAGIREPGRHLISIDLQLLHPDAAPDFATYFDQSSLCVMRETHNARNGRDRLQGAARRVRAFRRRGSGARSRCGRVR